MANPKKQGDKSLSIKKGDTVKVIAGRDKGAEGKVIQVCLLYTSPSPRDS